MSRSAAVASPHALATAAGERALRDGGSAVDAAIAAAITTAVVYPHNTSIGGDVVALLRSPDGRIVCVNATGWAPAAVDADRIAADNDGRMPGRGALTVTVPGAVAGWAALHALGARLPWEAHFRDAIRLARDGFVVGHSLAFCLSYVWPRLPADPGMSAVFAPDGRPVRRGERVVQPALADTLAEVASAGPAGFYEGEVPRRIVDLLSSHGSAMSVDDFSSFEAETTASLSRPWRGLDVHTSPPNTQGFALLRTLRTLGSTPPDAVPPLALAHAFDEGNALRTRALGDPRGAAVDVGALIDSPVPQGAADTPAPLRPRGDTIGVASADADGWAVSLIQSVFELFGSGLLEPSTGVILQNRGAMFGLEEGHPGRIAPRMRPPHTLMPVMSTRAGALHHVAACMGGYGQPQIHAQLLLALEAGASPSDALDAPRWIVGAQRPDEDPRTVYAEAGVADDAIAAFVDDGRAVVAMPDRSELFGHANLISIRADGGLVAASDPRSDGAAVVAPLASPAQEMTP